MFAIRVECLTGRYVATAYDDRSRAEWPPHPARLFSALVATWAETDGDAEEREALRFLQRCSPPRIVAEGPDIARRSVVPHFVPVNDTSVLSEVNTLDKLVEAEATAAESTDAKSRAKAEKVLAKAIAAHEKKCADVIAVGKSSAQALKDATRVLPDRRGRQPRTFPSVTLTDPVITFVFDEDAGAHLAPLDRLSRRLARVGHSASLVSSRTATSVPPGGWVPDPEGGTILRWVSEGQLERLDAAYELHRATEPRVLPATFVTYRYGDERREAEPHPTCFGDDWVLLHLKAPGPRRTLPVTAVPEVARAVRGALMRHAPQPPMSILTGHDSGGGPSEADHVAIVPLPDIGHAHADGHLLAVALVLPRVSSDAERRHLYEAVSRWLRPNADGIPTGTLTLGPAGRWTVTVDIDGDPRAGVQVGGWAPIRGAREWATATPVALDRNPGDLLGDRDAQDAAHAEAEATVKRACLRIGLPAPAQVAVSFRPPWRGAAKIDHHHPPFPRRDGRLRRVQVHVRLRFDEPVRGPILLGAGRYLGLGLFRPIARKE
ncbi:MAG: type I-U CRISPR-associated protein Cas5/Cas6 [Myxococcales bacterium]|nr:type I-U CRISPR-associated protein Cas5/Cas6 [Myxococcales bacterium]